MLLGGMMLNLENKASIPSSLFFFFNRKSKQCALIVLPYVQMFQI